MSFEWCLECKHKMHQDWSNCQRLKIIIIRRPPSPFYSSNFYFRCLHLHHNETPDFEPLLIYLFIKPFCMMSGYCAPCFAQSVRIWKLLSGYLGARTHTHAHTQYVRGRTTAAWAGAFTKLDQWCNYVTGAVNMQGPYVPTVPCAFCEPRTKNSLTLMHCHHARPRAHWKHPHLSQKFLLVMCFQAFYRSVTLSVQQFSSCWRTIRC